MINYNFTFPEYINLTSQDGTLFKISGISASLSRLLKGAMQDFTGEINVNIIEVDSSTLKIVVDYLNKWCGSEPPDITKPIKSCNMIENCDEWSAIFINSFSLEEVGDLAIAGNFMEIPSLVDLACAKIASLCYGKSDNDLYKEFNMKPSFFSKEELEIIKQENSDWLEDDYEKLLEMNK